MEVLAISKKRILRNLAPWLGIALAAGVIYFVIVALLLGALLKGHLADDQVKPVAAGLAVLIILAGGVFCVWRQVNRLARCRLALEGDTLTVRAERWGRKEKCYAIRDIDWIAFGQEFNAAERLVERLHHLGVPRTGGIRILRDLKAGRLIICDREGHRKTFHLIDKAFDRNDVRAFAAQLSRRGVSIGGPGSSSRRAAH